MTYEAVIITHLKSQFPEWVYGYLLEREHTPFGWLGPRGMRTAREMVNKGTLERRVEGKFVQYRYRDPVIIDDIIPQRSKQQVLV